MLIPYAFVLWSFGFFQGVETDFNNGSIFADWLYETLSLSDLNYTIFAFLLVLIQTLMINFLANRHKIQEEENYLPALFYVLISSCSVLFFGLSPVLLGMTFLIPAMYNLLMIYKIKEAGAHHFNAGFFIACASLCYGSLSLFIIFGLIAILNLRSFNIREFLQLISGFLVPYIILFTIFFYMGDVIDGFWAYIISFYDRFHLENSFNSQNYLSLIILGIVLIILLSQYFSFLEKKNIKTKKQINLLYIFIIFIVLSAFVQSGVWIEHLVLLAIPYSILMSLWMLKMNKKWLAELTHLALFLFILFGHYYL